MSYEREETTSLLHSEDGRASVEDGKDPKAAPELTPAEKRRQWLIAIGGIIGLVICGAGDRISFKLMCDAMPSYTYFLHQLTMVTYIVVFFVPVIATGQLKAITWKLTKKFIVMGFLDCMATLTIILASPRVFGPIQILLLQGAIPATLIVSKLILKRTYLWVHYLGSLVIIAGLGVAVAPQLDHSEIDSKSAMLWMLLFFSANIPIALSTVYKEHTFRTAGVEIDINLMNAWVSVYQFFFGLSFAPFQSALEGTAFTSIPTAFADGSLCLFTHNQDPAVLGFNGQANICSVYSSWTVAATFSFNILWNVFILLMIKYSSATAMFVANGLTIPLANLGFTFPFLPASERVTLAPLDYVSLASTVLGLVIYRLKDEPAPAEPPEIKPLMPPAILAPDATSTTGGFQESVSLNSRTMARPINGEGDIMDSSMLPPDFSMSDYQGQANFTGAGSSTGVFMASPSASKSVPRPGAGRTPKTTSTFSSSLNR